MSTFASLTTPRPTRAGIDPRGPRFVASATGVVLALVLLVPGPVAVVLLAFQTLVFAVGALRGVQHTPYASAFRVLVRPRLAPPVDLEDPRPPRFAQSLGLVFAGVGLVGLASGATAVFLVATALALVAALLNAVFGLCLGCELYLILRRAANR